MSYFSNFPAILYDGTIATNITLRAKLKDDIAKYLTSYYEYEVKEGKRPDHVAKDFFNDPYLSWVVFYSNDTIDPLAEWYMDDVTFENYMIKKYGTLDEARSRIAFYRVSWFGDESTKTIAEYNDTAFVAERKYWNPVVDPNGNIIYYKRKELDLVVETNRTYKVTYSSLTGDALEIGDIVLKYNGNSLIGRGEISFIGADYFVVKHVYDHSGYTGTMTVRNKNITFTVDSAEVLAADIPYMAYSGVDEEKYWEPIYFYDYEVELNERRRLIRVINKAYVRQLVGEMRTVFKT
jgi:hypothetical protein